MCSPAGGGPAFPGRRRPNPLQSRGAVAGAVTLPGRAGLSDKRSASGGGLADTAPPRRRSRPPCRSSPAPPIPSILTASGGAHRGRGDTPLPTHPPTSKHPDSQHPQHPPIHLSTLQAPPLPPFPADTGARRVAAAAWARAGPSGLRLGPVGRRPLAGRSRL